jgi:hypothetical protein
VENKGRRRASCTAAPYLGTGSSILLFGPFGFASKLFPPIGFCILASLKDWLLGFAAMLSRPLELNKGGSKLQTFHVNASICCFAEVDEPILPKPVEPV